MFIGIGMDEPAIRNALQECLLTDEEYAEEIQAWQCQEDPFPPWNVSIDEAVSGSAQDD